MHPRFLQSRPAIPVPEPAAFEGDPVHGKRESAELARRGDVRPHAHAGGFEALGELDHRGIPLHRFVEQALQLLARGLLARPEGHVDFFVAELALFRPGFAQAGRKPEAMILFQLLRGFDGAARFPLPQPDASVQAYATREEVDVVMLGVLMPHGHPRRVLGIEPHVPQELARHRIPARGFESLAGRQRQRAVPNGFADVGTESSNGGELARESARVAPGQVPTDELGFFRVRGFAACVEDVVERAAKAAAAANLGFHPAVPRGRG